MVDPAVVLDMRGISKTFPGVKALDNVNFDLVRGEVHALCGENGAGKSTLIKILCGAYRPDTGSITLEGTPITFHHPAEAQHNGISIIYQEFNLLPDRTIAQNIFLGREPMRGFRVDDAKMNADTRALLNSVEIDIDPRTPVGELRVAQQQVVEIAKAISFNAKILLMDEPTAALSPNEVDSLMALVKRLSARGVTVVYISHRLDENYRIADRATVLKDGQHILTAPLSTLKQRDLVTAMVGRELSDLFPPLADPAAIGEPILDVRGVYVSDWLKDISFTVRRGEILGIAGLEGSGRTFLARALFGAERISRGSVTLLGKALHLRRPSDAIQAGIGFITEDRKREGLMLPMSIRRNIALPSLRLRQRFGLIEFAKEAQTVEHYTESLDVRGAGQHTEVQFLSGGNQQKVVLAKWLATEARMLIFDEPTRGIDVGAKASIHTLMRKLASEGIGVIMISSELPEIIGMSDRILVMKRGELVAEFPAGNLSEAEIMAAATGTTLAKGVA